ncbi:ASCH domain-containing protein [Ottowia sp.]|uniref:ASCH domain-containing protein n=1 Tax=Ottowia sp. TaxID=1898956 RepID=UPI0025CDD919|nr:ASCH domain-containing protein [Ottowia sp.]MBK6616410.1 ASCH domain-containing protein [Ottowia sp.]
MKALSVRQPWAWLIVQGLKDIENRTWKTNVRGRVLIHAAQAMTQDEWLAAVRFAHFVCGVPSARLQDGCEFDQLQRGGFVGSAEIVDCVDQSHSPWFVGKKGFVMADAQTSEFRPYKGQLGFFEVP